MKPTIGSGTVERNNVGPRETGPEPIPSLKGMGGAVTHSASVGTRRTKPERLRVSGVASDSRRSQSSQASSAGTFGLCLDGDTGSAPAPVAVRQVAQDTSPEVNFAALIKQLRARRRAIEVELDGVPIGNEHFEQRRQLCNRRHEFCEQIEAIETLGDGGPRLMVLLDDYASTLVRRRLASEQDATAEDVVCAALPFMLGEEDDHYPEEEIAKATARRLGTEQKEAA